MADQFNFAASNISLYETIHTEYGTRQRFRLDMLTCADISPSRLPIGVLCIIYSHSTCASSTRCNNPAPGTHSITTMYFSIAAVEYSCDKMYKYHSSHISVNSLPDELSYSNFHCVSLSQSTTSSCSKTTHI